MIYDYDYKEKKHEFFVTKFDYAIKKYRLDSIAKFWNI